MYWYQDTDWRHYQSNTVLHVCKCANTVTHIYRTHARKHTPQISPPTHTLKIHTCSYTFPHHTPSHTTHTYEPGCSVIHEPFSSSISTIRQWNSLLPTSKLGMGGGRGRDGRRERRERRKDRRREGERERDKEVCFIYHLYPPTHTHTLTGCPHCEV